MAIKLYSYWRSSAAYRVRIALNLKGLEADYCPVNLLAGEHKTDDYLARNPAGLLSEDIDRRTASCGAISPRPTPWSV